MKVKKLHETALIPEYQSSGAGCFDIGASKRAAWEPISISNRIRGFQTIVSTGLAFEIPEGYTMKIYPRSGWGFKHNIQLANGTGIIDSDYRGEVMVKLIAFCPSSELPMIGIGTRVAQAELSQSFRVRFEEVGELTETERGEGGFGSTGT